MAPWVICAALLVSFPVAAPIEADGPFQYHTLTPCRVFDTRDVSGPTGGQPLQDDPNPAYTFEVQGLCGVPVGAAAVTVNVTAVFPTDRGFLTLFPSGITTPLVSSLNFPASGNTGNGAIVPLADQAVEAMDLSIYARVLGGGTVHVVLDVTGYFDD
ncbi:MAG: hypothetical protein ACRD21_00320 [Vicinamibacteria bacterium]